ncbi:MAG: serine--tRNA ligase [Candidatus Vogelbacteria bacterium RIFOXYD1_FULL_46_19]|uniref:Serine--tRNA ligase n=1 Tax=Candidatus Vogelbacteria bacterium RIFOXYD1_FULL_46_19 TaxID=1802439 RepID=A0A1G2QH01_9BACT|nr:MAG: serine--tRNA ligase [Candidatus Vogelbacteria bacterium RIFOXYD1_FULL_46_19]
MLDIKFIRENKDLVQAAAEKKKIDFQVDELLAVDTRRLKVLAEVELMRSEQNEANQLISQTTDPDERQRHIAEMKVLKDELQLKEEKLKTLVKEWQQLMIRVPNVPDMSVPAGDDDSANQEIKVWGDKPQFSFSPKNHIDIMTGLKMVDLERGTKVAGFRGYFLQGAGVRLSFALWQHAFAMLRQAGYEEMLVPSLVRREPFLGTGYLPQGEEDLYQTQDGDFLAGTGEVATMGYFMDEVLPLSALPKKLAAWSPCFRREAGSHGKDTRGLIRLHEFYKVEQVVLCEARHDESVHWHEELLKLAESYMQSLNIPYRVVVNCGGDLGLGQVKKYDLEAWVPLEEKYRETHSISYFHDFQARRLNTKYLDAEGKNHFVHSLNGTMAATPRLLVALIENYQQADGTILVPEALQPYFGQTKIGFDN